MLKGIGLIIIGVLLCAIPFCKSIDFKQECTGYIKQAADANTVELASNRLSKAIEYAEKNGLTKGYTSVFYRTEDENIGFWYQNLKACQKELADATNASQLEKSNVLMKVRESLTDEGEKGTVLTVPAGLYKYPNNLLYNILWVLGIGAILFGLVFFSDTDLW